MQLGVLLAYAIGVAGVGLSALAWLSLVAPLLFVASAVRWLPETPFWLLCNGRERQARSTMRWLMNGGGAGDDDDDDRADRDEWLQLRQARDEAAKSIGYRAACAELFNDRAQRRALLIICAVTGIQVLCGSLTTIAYAERIFAELVGGGNGGNNSAALTAGQVSLIFGGVQLISATVSAAAVDVIGRRPLLLGSVAGTGVCNAVVSASAYLRLDASWLPVAAVMLGVVSYFGGLATVIFALLGELLPPAQRRCGAAVYALLSAALIFAVNKLFQVVADAWGQAAAFAAFAACSAVFGPVLWWCVPETRGMDGGVLMMREALAGRRWQSADKV